MFALERKRSLEMRRAHIQSPRRYLILDAEGSRDEMVNQEEQPQTQ
jgi:hypothetical protein